MAYTKEKLQEAKRQIDSTLHKLRETVRTLEGKENRSRYKSQITLRTGDPGLWPCGFAD